MWERCAVPAGPVALSGPGGEVPDVAAGARLGRRRGFPAVELRLPGVPSGPGRLAAVRAPHAVVGRGERRPALLVPAQRLARRPGADRGLPRVAPARGP